MTTFGVKEICEMEPFPSEEQGTEQDTTNPSPKVDFEITNPEAMEDAHFFYGFYTKRNEVFSVR